VLPGLKQLFVRRQPFAPIGRVIVSQDDADRPVRNPLEASKGSRSIRMCRVATRRGRYATPNAD
jgi:hypothetical protein